MNRGRARLARVTALVSALATVGVLAACTSGTEPLTEPTGSDPTATEPGPGPVDPNVVPTLPDGDLEVQAVVKGRITPAMEDTLNEGQVIVTEGLFLLIPSDQRIYAIDRETGEQRWEAKVWQSKDGYGAGDCRHESPPEGATAVVVFSGFRCGTITSYSLDDGSVLEREVAGSLDNSVSAVARVSGRVYFADDHGLNEVLPDGTTELVTANAQLGLHGLRGVDGLTTVAGSEVLMARSEYEYPRDGGTLFGLRVTEEGDLEAVWKRSTTQVHGGEAIPDSTFLSDNFDGVLYDLVRRGISTPRLLTVDPETGRRDHTFVLQRDPPGGYPAWIENKFEEETVVDARGQLFSAAGAGGFGYSPDIVRYDLARDRIAWDWDPDFRPDASISGYPLAVSDDGEHVYVLWSAYGDFRLVELDYATGEQQRVWRVPPAQAETLTHATGVMAGNQLVLYSSFGSRYDNGLGLVLRVGGG